MPLSVAQKLKERNKERCIIEPTGGGGWRGENLMRDWGVPPGLSATEPAMKAMYGEY